MTKQQETYPIQYDMKISIIPNIDTLRTYLTKEQNEYYSDYDLNEVMSDYMYQFLNEFMDILQERYGRYISKIGMEASGNIEVSYILEQDKVQKEISNLINHERNYLNEHVVTPEFYKDIAEILYVPENINKINNIK